VKEFFAVLILLSLGLAAQAKEKVPKGIIQSETLAGYIARMQHAELALSARTQGSLWVDGGLLANTAADYKARNAGDLITILVVQDITANNSGSVASARNFSASSGISALPGKLKTSGVENLFSPTSTSSLTGKARRQRPPACEPALRAGLWRCCKAARWSSRLNGSSR
jgi:flagellar basal body L-ring protein FlgH